MINWKVRIRQKWFWLTLIPAVLLLLDKLWKLFALLGSIQAGHLYDGPLMEALLAIVGSAFAVLVIVGIPVDTTTEGYGDSARALTYEEPAPNASEYGLDRFELDSETRKAFVKVKPVVNLEVSGAELARAIKEAEDDRA